MHVQKMMADAPYYDYEDGDDTKGKKGTAKMKLSADNVGDVVNFFNSIPR